MAIAYRAGSTAGVGAGTSLTITKPSGVVDGDILIVNLYSENVGWTLPSGWTTITTQLSNSGTFVALLTLAWKRASSEPTSYTFLLDEISWRIGAMGAWSGCLEAGSPIDSDVATLTNSVSDASAASITTSVDDTMLLIAVIDWNGGNQAPPTGMTQRAALAGTELFEEARPTAGATGVRSIGGGTAPGGWASATFALLPAIGGGGGTEYDQSVSGAVTPSGTASKGISRAAAGTLGIAGTIAKGVAVALVGAPSLAGSVVSQSSLARSIAGAVGVAGAVVKQSGKALSGVVSAASTVGRAMSRSITGAMSAAATVARGITRAIAGAIAPDGSATAQSVLERFLTGTLSASGSIQRSATRSLLGVLAPVGSTARAISRSLSSAVGLTGNVSRSVGRLVSGAFVASSSLVGDLVVGVIEVALSGALAFAGAVNRLTSRNTGGNVAPSGTASRAISRAVAAAVGFAGVVTTGARAVSQKFRAMWGGLFKGMR